MRPLNNKSKATKYNLVLETLKSCNYNRTKASKALGISVRTVRHYILQYRRNGLVIPFEDRHTNSLHHQQSCLCSACSKLRKELRTKLTTEKKKDLRPQGVTFCDKCGQKTR